MLLEPNRFCLDLHSVRRCEQNVLLSLRLLIEIGAPEVDFTSELHAFLYLFGRNQARFILLTQERLVVVEVHDALHIREMHHAAHSFGGVARFLNGACRPLDFRDVAVIGKREPKLHFFPVDFLPDAVHLRIAGFLALSESDVAIVEEGHGVFGRNPMFFHQGGLLIFDHEHTAQNGVFNPVGWQPGTAAVLKEEQHKDDSDPETDPVKFKPAKEIFHR